MGVKIILDKPNTKVIGSKIARPIQVNLRSKLIAKVNGKERWNSFLTLKIVALILQANTISKLADILPLVPLLHGVILSLSILQK